MNDRKVFAAALGLTEPWLVEAVHFDVRKGHLDISLNFPQGSTFPCPVCGDPCPVYDTESKSWRHLNFFQHTTRVHARAPRVKCEKHGVKTANLPWARPMSGFTLLFESLILTYARNGMTPTAIGRMVGEHDTRIWRILDYYVFKAHDRQDVSSVELIGIDETARAKGHQYVTVFISMVEGKVVFATEGKDHDTVQSLREDFERRGGRADKVTDFSMDMSAAFVKGVQDQFPSEALTFDRYHVIALANEAVDQVRREEQKSRPELRGSRFAWLKNEGNRTEGEQEIFQQLRGSNLKTARAWRIKDTLQAIYDQPAEESENYLNRWYYWATHSRLVPMIRLAKTIKKHWQGVLRWFSSRLTQGLVEGINSLIQAAKAKARGFRSVRKMLITIYLVAGKLDFQLASPLPTR